MIRWSNFVWRPLRTARAVGSRSMLGNPSPLAQGIDARSALRSLWGHEERPEGVDEWARCGVERRGDICHRFLRNFYFGREGDDSMTALAFDTKRNAFGTRLNVLYSSDLGHFDLPDMRDAAHEAWELVDHGLINAD